MLIIPAIDIKAGKVVRLCRGEFDSPTVYSSSPVSVAKQWESEGAKLLHVVDLDGALYGEPKNTDTVESIAKAVSIPVQAGGGVRTKEAIEQLISCGVSRVVLGTAACEDELFLSRMLADFGKKLTISIDVKSGLAATKGWKAASGLKPEDLIKGLEAAGLEVFIYTDISRDGMLKGPNVRGIKKMLSAVKSSRMIASGGVSCLNDLLGLEKLQPKGLIGVIVGKALYEKRIDLRQAIELC